MLIKKCSRDQALIKLNIQPSHLYQTQNLLVENIFIKRWPGQNSRLRYILVQSSDKPQI